MKQRPWLKLLNRKSGPEVPLRSPIWLGNRSNGEYYHEQNAKERLAEEIILRESEHHARRYGMDRREFLASSAGFAFSLGVINLVNGCGSNGENGGYQVPNLDDCVARGGEPLTHDDFIFDIQTHHFDPEASWRQTNPVYESFLNLLSSCGADDPVDCFSKERYAEAIFLNSDTTMAVLSSWPANVCTDTVTTGCGLPLPNTSIVGTRDWFNELAMSERIVNHCQIMPNLDLAQQLDVMDEMHTRYGVAGWKMYPAWGPNGVGFWLDDPEGLAVINKGVELGVKIFCVHKGLPIPGFDVVHNHPWDIGRVAAMYPDCHFVVYHSAICAGQTGFCSADEGPYDPEAPREELGGIDTLIRALQENDIPPNANVYAELGSCWANVMNQPDMAQHAMGKLLRYVGEDNVVWGTDVMVATPAQAQIEAFRAFQISEENQATYGYPEITPAIRAKVFGRNAAAVFGVDPERERCRVDANQIEIARREFDAELGRNRWAIQAPLGPRNRREFLRFARQQKAEGRPG
jgi:uncharacterized protein